MTNFEFLRCFITLGYDIDRAACDLAGSKFCPKYRQDLTYCDPRFEDCTECWKHYLEQEAHFVNYVDL